MKQEDMEEEINLYYQEIDYYTEVYYLDLLIKEIQDHLDFYDYMIRSRSANIFVIRYFIFNLIINKKL